VQRKKSGELYRAHPFPHWRWNIGRCGSPQKKNTNYMQKRLNLLHILSQRCTFFVIYYTAWGRDNRRHRLVHESNLPVQRHRLYSMTVRGQVRLTRAVDYNSQPLQQQLYDVSRTLSQQVLIKPLVIGRCLHDKTKLAGVSKPVE